MVLELPDILYFLSKLNVWLLGEKLSYSINKCTNISCLKLS